MKLPFLHVKLNVHIKTFPSDLIKTEVHCKQFKMSVYESVGKKRLRYFGLEWPLPAPTAERTLAIALKMSLLILQNAKRKFAFVVGTITARLKALVIRPLEALLHYKAFAHIPSAL